jgi:hypothetical protein
VLWNVVGGEPVQAAPDFGWRRLCTGPAPIAPHALILRTAEDDDTRLRIVCGIGAHHVTKAHVVRIVTGKEETTIGAASLLLSE